MMNTEPTGLTTSSNSPNLSLAGVSQLNSTLTRPNTEAIGTNEVKTNIEVGRNLNSPDSSTNSREEEEFNSDFNTNTNRSGSDRELERQFEIEERAYERNIQEVRERHRRRIAELQASHRSTDRTNRLLSNQPQTGSLAPAVDVDIRVHESGDRARRVNTPVRDGRGGSLPNAAGQSIFSPPRPYPVLGRDSMGAASAVEYEAYNTSIDLQRGPAGIDLTAVAQEFSGSGIKPHIKQPQNFSGRSIVGLTTLNSLLTQDATHHQDVEEWVNYMEIYLTLTNVTHERKMFLLAISYLEGAAKTFIEQALLAPEVQSAESSNNSGGVSVAIAQTARPLPAEKGTWKWLKDKLMQHFNPVERNQIIEDQLNILRQQLNEGVTEYYQKFTKLVSYIRLSRKEEFSKFRAGLRSDLRNYIDDIVRIKRGLTGGAALMTMEEAYNLCIQKEISLQRDRQDAYRHRMFAAFNAFAARNSYRTSAKPTQQTNTYAAASYSKSNQANSYGKSAGSTGQNRNNINPLLSNHNISSVDQLSSLHMIDGQEKELGQSHYQFDEGDISYSNEIGESGQLNAVNSFSSSGRSAIECFNCGKLGHISRFCKNKKQPHRKKSNSSGEKDGKPNTGLNNNISNKKESEAESKSIQGKE